MRRVFDVIAQPYLGRRTRAVAEKITLLHTSADRCSPITSPAA
ncbi:hypothetical protein [Actinopolymorpha pittospori]|uniref:Uncharacterized protein n=1 Tax=Actinopolymorpha pittospori TaxID=648752 RepID=A0A927MQC4_9ACTN|nr:hypothetical protein [Actinopolymorpha pittospori]MBE1604139.1 hypothetical protein [Actinopolymorpha pittospori]